MSKLKMGIIGVGSIAQDRHIPALSNLQDKVEVVAVQDIDRNRARMVAEKFAIPQVYEDYHDLFKFVDAVIICTPNVFHAEISIAALRAGVHVLCEKPMAITADQGEQMLEAANKSGKLLSVGYHYRFTESAQLAKKAMLSGDIGDPLVTRVEALRRRKVPGWGVFTNKDLQGGGSLIDFGCHLLELSLWLLDNPKPSEVLGKTYNRLSKTPNQLNDWGQIDHEDFNVDDHATAYITFDNGTSMLFECSWAANIKEDYNQVSISGVDGGLSLYPFELYQPRHGSFFTSTTEVNNDEMEAGFLQIQNFVESCLGQAQLVVKPEEALMATRLIEAIYKSCESGQSVRL